MRKGERDSTGKKKRKNQMKENKRKLQIRKRGKGNLIKLNVVEENGHTEFYIVKKEKQWGKNSYLKW